MTNIEQALVKFFREHGPATASDALRAVPEAKRRHVDRLHHLKVLVSAPSPGRGNMLKLGADSVLAEEQQGYSPYRTSDYDH